MKAIIVTMLCFIPTFISAQTFKCTSIDTFNEETEYKIQELKAEALGTKMLCEIFSSDIKVTLFEEKSNGELDKETIVFTKNKQNVYECKGRFEGSFAILKLETILGLITKIKIISYEKNKHIATMIFERELF